MEAYSSGLIFADGSLLGEPRYLLFTILNLCKGPKYLLGSALGRRLAVLAVAKALLHHLQCGLHLLAGGAVRDDRVQLTNHILGSEVLLDQLRHDLLSGDQVWHGE